ncbi:hypothetical protein [Fluviicoccus keumensis]|uniref:hypothetical protein n=1 Tax=Fluviicoccus keumensis TaxID=1435465 RepID=UPI00102CB329|nr:hypothetical protein [Fluviicoccus keumensis]
MNFGLKSIALMVSLFSTTIVFADKTIECERYKVLNNKKTEGRVFRLNLAAEQPTLRYMKVSGSDWFLPSESLLQILWKSPDELRVVAEWKAQDYGVNKERWSPIYILDIDFGKPDFRDASYGGLADFSEIISSPWKQECKRTD